MNNQRFCLMLLMGSIIGLLVYVRLLNALYSTVKYENVASNVNKYITQFEKDINLTDPVRSQNFLYGDQITKTIVLQSQHTAIVGDTNHPKNTAETITQSQINSEKPINDTNKPLFVIGILSYDKFSSRRKAVRETWLSSLLTSKSMPFQIKYKFLFDKPSNITRNEDKVYHDVFCFNLGISGYDTKLSVKLQAWFKYALKTYPNATLIAKVDDDAFPCTPQIFHRIRNITSTRLYYGFQHKGYNKTVRVETRIDEHFLVLGRDLAAGFVNETICAETSDYSKRACKYGDVAVAEWIHKHNVNVDCKTDHSKMLHFDRHSGIEYKIYILQNSRLNYCEENLLFHKSSETLMYRFHHFNKHYDDDTSKYVNNTIKEVTMTGDVPVQVIGNLTSHSMQCLHCIIAIANAELKPRNGIRKFASSNSWCIIIVADQYIPNEKEYLNKTLGLKKGNKIHFLSRKTQDELYPALSETLYWNHYGRRNIGYIHAVHLGALYILDIYNMSMNRKKDLSSSINSWGNERKNGVYPHFSPCFSKNTHQYFNIDLLSYYMFNMLEFTNTLCVSNKSTVQFGALHFVPVYNSSIDGASKDKAIPFVRTKISNETFYATATLWSSAAFKYLALPITVGLNESVIVRNLLIGEHFRVFNLSNVFVPHWVHSVGRPLLIADSVTGLKLEWIDLPTNQSQIAQAVQNSTLFLKTDNLDKVYRHLYQQGHIGYDDLVFSKAWVATISAITSLPRTKKKEV